MYHRILFSLAIHAGFDNDHSPEELDVTQFKQICKAIIILLCLELQFSCDCPLTGL